MSTMMPDLLRNQTDAVQLTFIETCKSDVTDTLLSYFNFL